MRSTAIVGDRPAADLTAQARIRDAAISAFAHEGFGASVRMIAERAEVSPGLITHHFGSKAGLRADCDAEVLRRYMEIESTGIDRPTAYLLDFLAVPGPMAELLVYMLRAIGDGGAPAKEFLDRLVDSMREPMRLSVEAGLIRPSRDEEARLRYLAAQGMGALLIRFLTAPDQSPDAFVASLSDARSDEILPSLELYTEGLLADPSVLDQYLAYIASADSRGGADPE